MIKFEVARLHFLSDAFIAVDVIVPIKLPSTMGNCYLGMLGWTLNMVWEFLKKPAA